MNNRVVIVTGGAYGIGRAIVRRFASAGYDAAIFDVDEQRGRELEAEVGPAMFVRCDVREDASVRAAVDAVRSKWPRIDVLVNNAGIEYYHPADQYTNEEWDAVVNTNLRGAWLLSRECMPDLRRTRGTIINIASIQGIATEPGVAPYAATKAGLMALTRGMALDFAADGVRVNAICPGAVLTGMMEKYLAQESDPGAMIQKMSEATPLGRIGQPEDIAGAVWFLASEDASWITGASLVVDGGALARHVL